MKKPDITDAYPDHNAVLVIRAVYCNQGSAVQLLLNGLDKVLRIENVKQAMRLLIKSAVRHDASLGLRLEIKLCLRRFGFRLAHGPRCTQLELVVKLVSVHVGDARLILYVVLLVL